VHRGKNRKTSVSQNLRVDTHLQERCPVPGGEGTRGFSVNYGMDKLLSRAVQCAEDAVSPVWVARGARGLEIQASC
jgi:hypothetical protein